MVRSDLVLLVFTLMLACTPRLTLAARQAAKRGRVEVPKKWYLAQDDDMTTCIAPGDAVEIGEVKRRAKEGFGEIVAAEAGHNPVTRG